MPYRQAVAEGAHEELAVRGFDAIDLRLVLGKFCYSALAAVRGIDPLAVGTLWNAEHLRTPACVISCAESYPSKHAHVRSVKVKIHATQVPRFQCPSNPRSFRTA